MCMHHLSAKLPFPNATKGQTAISQSAGVLGESSCSYTLSYASLVRLAVNSKHNTEIDLELIITSLVFFLLLVWLKSPDPCTAPSRPPPPSILKYSTLQCHRYKGVTTVQTGTRQILMLLGFFLFFLLFSFMCESIHSQCFSVNEGGRQGVIVSCWRTTTQTEGPAAGKWTEAFSCQKFNKQLTSTSAVLLMNCIYGGPESSKLCIIRKHMQTHNYSANFSVCMRIKAKK